MATVRIFQPFKINTVYIIKVVCMCITFYLYSSFFVAAVIYQAGEYHFLIVA